jgi:glutathionylspermidine synthase
MQRRSVSPRGGWQRIVEQQGLIWHGDAANPYWDESAYYAFDLAEIERIEAATETVHDLFLQAGEAIVGDRDRMTRFGIPAYCHEAIAAAWYSEPPALNYGRFDFGYDGHSELKLFEFNCDTPTSMLEAAVIQWEWKEALFPQLDQFNSLHEKLIERWADLRARLPGNRIWFTHAADPSHEDTITTTYMRDLAAQAGLETHAVVLDDIGIDADGRIVDSDDQLISAIFKLYPWEWIVAEEFGPDIVRHLPDTHWICFPATPICSRHQATRRRSASAMSPSRCWRVRVPMSNWSIAATWWPGARATIRQAQHSISNYIRCAISAACIR